MALQKISELDFKQIIFDRGAPYFPSPPDWEDEVLYFMLVDTFSDGQEKGFLDINGASVNTGSTPMFTAADAGNAIGTEKDAAIWRDAGGNFVGGNLRGLSSKMGYLRRTGVTAIWLSPVLKQVNADNTYHGYGIQNFFDVDPHFGTRDDLRDMVKTAHENGIRVVLDIILNHTGQVFIYDPDRYDTDDGHGHTFRSGTAMADSIAWRNCRWKKKSCRHRARRLTRTLPRSTSGRAEPYYRSAVPPKTGPLVFLTAPFLSFGKESTP